MSRLVASQIGPLSSVSIFKCVFKGTVVESSSTIIALIGGQRHLSFFDTIVVPFMAV